MLVLIYSPARTLVVTERGRGGGGGGVGCNRVHDLHIVFVLLYPVCRSVTDLSCLDVIQSLRMFYVILFLGVTKRRCVRPRERARGNTNGLSLITTIKKKKKKKKKRNNWLWLVYCSLLPACYFHRWFTSARCYG